MSRCRSIRVLRIHVTFLLMLAAAMALSAASCRSYLPAYTPDSRVGVAAEKAAAKVEAGAGEKAQTPAPKSPGIAPAAGEKAGGPLEISVQDAVLMAVENNRELVVQRETPNIVKTFEDEQRAVFDPILGALVSGGRTKYEENRRNFLGRRTTEESSSFLSASMLTLLPTGTTVGVDLSTGAVEESFRERLAQTRAGLTVTQALLRGFGPEVNLASLRQARLDTQASEYMLRGFAEAVVAQAEEAYWDYVQSLGEAEVASRGAVMAEKQLSDVLERIKAGTLADTERASAQVEVDLRRQNVIDARSQIAKTRLHLLRLLNPQGGDLWAREIRCTSPIVKPKEPLDDVELHAQVAMKMRPDLNQARLAVQRGDLEIIKTRNGLLPRLDLFVTLGRTAYSRSFSNATLNPNALGYDVFGGVSMEYPVLNRGPKALYQRATLTRQQASEAVANLEQLVQEDVRTAYVEVIRAQEQVVATAATSKSRAEQLTAENEKYRFGRSSSFSVARAQNDLVDSQFAEVSAATEVMRAYVQLYLLEGSLLDRRGISAPGRDPSKMPPARP